MAVSQRKFLPWGLLLVGLILFAVLGFGNSEVQPPPSVNPPVQRDEAAIDEVARQAAEQLIDSEQGQAGQVQPRVNSSSDSAAKIEESIGQSSATVASVEVEQSERLNLSGQTADDALTRSADGKFDITFDHIKFEIPDNELYSPSMLTDQIRKLDGEEVKLRGYIRPSFKQRGLKGFIFVRDNKECCFGPGAALFDCVVVKLAKDQATDYTTRPVAVTGKFVLKEYIGPDGDVWAIYRMKNASVSR